MKIALAIITYDREKELRQTYASWASLSLLPVENPFTVDTFVFDDGSPNNYAERIKEGTIFRTHSNNGKPYEDKCRVVTGPNVG